MNVKVLSLLAVLGAGLTGCASWRHQLTPPIPNNTPVVLPEIKESPVTPELMRRVATQPVAPFDGEGWENLFDGKSLADWRVTEFDQGGSVTVTNGLLVLHRGNPFVGVNGLKEIPKVNYEIAFDAMRLEGDDFFCGLTFPVGDSHCSLIVGGWGGGLVGLSNLDGASAAENETTQYVSFESGRWYRIRLRVTEQRIQAWIEQKQVVDLLTVGRLFEVRFGEIMLSRPFGLCAWDTSAAYRAIKIRPVTEPEIPVRR
jgi:hypothetical protein